MRGISSLAEELLASQDVLYSVDYLFVLFMFCLSVWCCSGLVRKVINGVKRNFCVSNEDVVNLIRKSSHRTQLHKINYVHFLCVVSP
jgi:hypothetical protein